MPDGPWDEEIDSAVSGAEVAAPEPIGEGEESLPLVEYVVPAAAYDMVDTDDEPRRNEPPPTPLPTPQADPALAESIRALQASLETRFNALQTAFDREIRAEATREKVVDRLHAELQEYKQDLLLNTLRPIFIDLIQLHDDLGKMLPAEDDDPQRPRLARLIGDAQQGIEDILYRQGVEPYSLPDPAFDPRRQRAVATIPTEEADLVKSIAARHRKGFQAGEKVIRPEIVSVYALRRGN